ncbi:MAG TPA: outer membrane beta-barrel protein [Xanthobacteraceae bacterium]
MKRTLLAGCVVSALVFGGAGADAADMPVKAQVAPAPTLSWTGFYFGGEVGERSAVVDPSVTAATVTAPGFTLNVLSPATCAGLPCPGGTSLDNAAFRGGLYAGINWQVSREWVAGIEGDFGWADRSRTLGGQMYPGGATAFALGASSFTVRTTWDASARGRLGVLVMPNVLFYGTGGASWLHVEATSNCDVTRFFSTCGLPGGFAPAVITNSATRLGWTIGAGLEAGVGDHWLLRSEYRFADYGTWGNNDTRICAGAPCSFFTAPGLSTTLPPVVAATTAYSTRLQTHTVNFGLAYKFGDALPAAAAPAAVMPVKATPRAEPTVSWSGPYIGGDVGTRAAVVDPSVTAATLTSTFILPAFTNVLGTSYCGVFVPCPGPTSLDNTALRAGAYAGYNWQVSREWLVGLEGDLGWASRSRTLGGEEYPGGSPAFIFGASSFTVKTTWDASARGRVGVLLVPDVLLYGTGGASWLHVEATSVCDATAQVANCGIGALGGAFRSAAITNSTTRLGWTVGAGLEVNWWSHWLLRGEYRYADYGTWANTDTRTCAGGFCNFYSGGFFNGTEPGATARTSYGVRLQTHTVRFGLAYKL